MNKAGKNNNQSLWENSVKVVVNIARVSTISLAEKSLQTKPPPGQLPPPPPSPPPATRRSITIMDATSLLTVPELRSRRRSQEPESNSKSASYLKELPEEKHMIREEGINNVDGRASAYIDLFHKRMQKDSVAASKLSPILLPPPPPPRRVK